MKELIILLLGINLGLVLAIFTYSAGYLVKIVKDIKKKQL